MKHAHGIGYLSTIEEGEPRLHPLEFVLMDGEFWAPLAPAAEAFVAACDGQRVEVLFMNDDLDSIRIHGVLARSDAPEDRQLLAQSHPASPPDAAVVKVIPETLLYHAPSRPSRYRRAA